MATLLITARARGDLDELIETRELPPYAAARYGARIDQLTHFPLSGRQVSGRTRWLRLLVGPWPWIITVYDYDAATDRVTVLTVQDARMRPATGSGRRP